MSPQQSVINELHAIGLGSKRIAKQLGVSVDHVKTQLHRIKKKDVEGGNKKGINQPLQYPSVLFETLIEKTVENEASNLVKELEQDKGLILTSLQKEVILLKSEGKGIKAIAASTGITTQEVQSNIDQAVAEIKRVQYSDDAVEDTGACEFLGGSMTENEAQVLSYMSKGMSVKSTAGTMGKSENAIRKTLQRAGTTTKVIKEKVREQRRSRFKNNYYIPPNSATIALLRQYYSKTLSRQERIEAEIILRSEGLIRAVPTIMKNNGQLLNMYSAQKRMKVFSVTHEEEAKLRYAPVGSKSDILKFSGASLILTNRYANEEEDGDEKEFTHIYAVDSHFWPAIQAAAGGIASSASDQDISCRQANDSVGRGSEVLLRDTGTNETFRVYLAGSQPQPSATAGCHNLSPKAPLAEALCGRQEGESITLEVIKGDKVEYQVLKVQNKPKRSD